MPILAILTLLGNITFGLVFGLGVLMAETPQDRLFSLALLLLIVGNIYCIKLAQEGALDD